MQVMPSIYERNWLDRRFSRRLFEIIGLLKKSVCLELSSCDVEAIDLKRQNGETKLENQTF